MHAQPIFRNARRFSLTLEVLVDDDDHLLACARRHLDELGVPAGHARVDSAENALTLLVDLPGVSDYIVDVVCTEVVS